MRLAGARVLLNGASGGIGRALALELARRGAGLALVARRAALLESLAAEIVDGGGVAPAVITADPAVRGSAAHVASRGSDALGGIDALVNNAGGGVGGSQWAVGDDDAAREALELNFWTPIALTASVVPAMRQRGSGTIVNVTSIGQVMPMWAMGHYVASKAALALATESLRLELTGSPLRVLEVIPGPTDTEVQGESKLVPGARRMLDRAPLGDPEVLARLIARAMRKDRRRVVYPRSLGLVYRLPGLYRVFAGSMARRLWREVDLADEQVVRSGSHGDEIARRARAEWRAERGPRG